MLASILPGIRHTRIPLVAGVMWFLVAWFAFGGDGLIPSASGGPLEADLSNLIDLAGRPTTVAALALLAMIGGSIIPTISRSAAAWLSARMSGLNRFVLFGIPSLFIGPWFSPISGGSRPHFPDYDVDVCYAIANDSHQGSQPVRWQDVLDHPRPHFDLQRQLRQNFEHPDWLQEHVQEAMPELHGPTTTPDPSDRWGDPIPVDLLEERIVESLEAEFDDLAVLLQDRHESIYNEVDRLIAEGDLRRAMFFPGLALAATLAAATNWLAWLLLLLPFALLWHGNLSQRSAQFRVFSAVRQGLIESPTVHFMEAIHRA